MSIGDADRPLSYAEIRLECLKLAHRLDRTPEQVIADARLYLSWVGVVTPTTGDSLPGDGSKASKSSPAKSRTSSPNP